MRLDNWEGLDGAGAERLSEASTEEEWLFSGTAIESSLSAFSASGTYSEELCLSLKMEKNMSMARDGQRAEQERREDAP